MVQGLNTKRLKCTTIAHTLTTITTQPSVIKPLIDLDPDRSLLQESHAQELPDNLSTETVLLRDATETSMQVQVAHRFESPMTITILQQEDTATHLIFEFEVISF